MNVIDVERLTHDDKPTIGVVRINGEPLCFSLEDRPREVKVKGDTCIPAGAYGLRWRTAGRWGKRFRDMGYPGSIELLNVPDFTDVLIHVGNTKGDTEGCILLGQGASYQTRTVAQSVAACKRLYTKVAQGGDWTLKIR